MNKEEFIQEIKKLNINYTDDMLDKLELYYNLLIEENNKYNLTSITEKKDVYLKHFYDSLTTIKIVELNNQKICDIGTGAGFPGIVLKIFYPELEIDLIEATLKKCKFLNMIIKKLNLIKIKVINERAELYSRKNREIYDIVISRAVAPLSHLLEYSIPLLKINGYQISMKSNVELELKEITNYYKLLNIELIQKETFNLPIEKSTRTLLKFKKIDKTSKKYPRTYKEIKNRLLK